jgi:effector-binding domain-containing protein
LKNAANKAYLGIRNQVPIRKLSKTIPQCLSDLFAWLGEHSIEAAGAPFIRYHVIDMAALMDVELGIPVAASVPGDGHVTAGALPAGRYAALIYTGLRRGIEANAALLEWGKAQGLVWDRWDDPKGDAFGGRYESFLTNPDDEPDQAKWETEVAIRLAD